MADIDATATADIGTTATAGIGTTATTGIGPATESSAAKSVGARCGAQGTFAVDGIETPNALSWESLAHANSCGRGGEQTARRLFPRNA